MKYIQHNRTVKHVLVEVQDKSTFKFKLTGNSSLIIWEFVFLWTPQLQSK